MIDNWQLESPARKLASVYMSVKQFVIEKGYAAEIDWQYDIHFDKVNESYFLREAAWVILSSGMRESVIRKKFIKVSEAFYNWDSAAKISAYSQECKVRALIYFNNPQKIDAIIKIAHHIEERGFIEVKDSIKKETINYIIQFPYMGPATAYHFAKNIGLPVVKPDRHLNRIAKSVGYSTPHDLCTDIAFITGDKISVIDLVIWRYATLRNNYLNLFTSIRN